MTTYKQGQDWQRDRNENTWLKAKVAELEAEVEKLNDEILKMQASAEYVDEEILDEEILDEEILDEEILDEEIPDKKCHVCKYPLYWDLPTLQYRHQHTHVVICGVGHDPSGNEYCKYGYMHECNDC